eukprot:6187369-Pleurochrysis_carterae.AAC.3
MRAFLTPPLAFLEQDAPRPLAPIAFQSSSAELLRFSAFFGLTFLQPFLSQVLFGCFSALHGIPPPQTTPPQLLAAFGGGDEALPFLAMAMRGTGLGQQQGTDQVNHLRCVPAISAAALRFILAPPHG